MKLNKFMHRPDQFVTAVQIDLDLPTGVLYHKWGGTQQASRGDWLLNNQGECYTVDQESFAATYREIQPGQYCKVGSVWAAVATIDGTIDTKEGQSSYLAGDYIVYNNQDGTDGYCVTAAKFLSMYEAVQPTQLDPDTEEFLEWLEQNPEK